MKEIFPSISTKLSVRLLQDLIDQHMRDNKGKPVMQLVMGGKFAQQIICRDLPHKSEKEEEFYQVRSATPLFLAQY